MYFSLVMYTSLCCMNFYWWSTMVRGMLKFFSKSKAAEKVEEIKKEQ